MITYSISEALTEKTLHDIVCGKNEILCNKEGGLVQFKFLEDKEGYMGSNAPMITSTFVLKDFEGKISNLRIGADDKENQIIIGHKLCIDDVGIYFSGKNNKVVLRNKCSLKGVYLYLNGDNNTIVIGNHSKLVSDNTGDVTIQSNNGGTITVGANCLLSGDILVKSATDYDIFSEEESKYVRLENDIYIGTRCIIGGGTVLGARCFVKDGSVVEGEYPKGSILQGNPAVVVEGK